MAGVQQNISYKRELFAGDIVEVRSSLLEIRDTSIRFLHEMRNAETRETAATCELTAVHLDREGRLDTVSACDPRDRHEASVTFQPAMA